MAWEDKLLCGWSMGGWTVALFLVGVLICSVAVRAAIATVKALKPWPQGRWRRRWWECFRIAPGFDLDPTILGTLELLAYPVLMSVQAWPVIGAWLGFKTLAQWDAWKQGRAQYNQFLIGNALVVMLSFVLAHLVRVNVTPC